MKTEVLRGLPVSKPVEKKLHLSKKAWLPALALMLLAVAGFIAYRVYAQANTPAASTASAVQTSVARAGDLTLTASGTGKTIAASSLSIGFADSGTLTEVLVNLGDKVKTGQVLARMQTTNTEATIAAGITSAQLAVLNAQQKLDDLNASAPAATAAALKAVEDAQKTLDDLQTSQSSQATAAQAVADAQKALDTAQSAYDVSHMTASQASIDAYYAAMLNAQDAYARILQAYNDDHIYNLAKDDITRANYEAKLSAARQTLATASANYNAAKGTASKTDQAVAEANLVTAKAALADAQRAYERAKNGPTDGEIAVAKAALTTAQANYARLKDGPDPLEVAIDQATLDDAKAQLELAKQKKVIEELAAPSDGTILAINSGIGENVGTSGFITLANLTQTELQVYVDETDMSKVKLGQEADVVFDALPDQTFIGKVTQINPNLVSYANVNAVEVTVQLDASAASQTEGLPVGTSASIDLISGRAHQRRPGAGGSPAQD